MGVLITPHIMGVCLHPIGCYSTPFTMSVRLHPIAHPWVFVCTLGVY